jgi:SNF2 family DNA or RNA helicase
LLYVYCLSSQLDRKYIGSFSFQYVVLDEAHCIKNSESSRFININKYVRAKNRLLLSGTPVQVYT